MSIQIKRSPRDGWESGAVMALVAAAFALGLVWPDGETQAATTTALSKSESSANDVPRILAMLDAEPEDKVRSFSPGPVGSITQVVKGTKYCLGGRVQLVQQETCDQSLDESFQAWRDDDSGTLRLKIGDRCIGVKSLKNEGAPVVAQPCSDGDPSQDWTFDRGRFVNAYSNKCLDIDESGKSIRSVKQRTCTNSETQVWAAPRPP